MQRMLEGTVTTVIGGLILWCVTIGMSQSVPPSQPSSLAQSVSPPPSAPSLQPIPSLAERPAEQLALSIAAPAALTAVSPPPAESREKPALLRAANPLPAPAELPGVAKPPPPSTAPVRSAVLGSILLYEDFSRYREGDATDWGPNTAVKMGLDRRKWLVSPAEGTHPVGRTLLLPNEFCFECRYSAYVPEVTRGILGWWKEPLSTKISFRNDQGVKYVIQWVIGCGNDISRVDLFGSSLCGKTYYHTIKLPGGTTSEVALSQPTGTLRINRENGGLKVLLDGQVAATGTMSPMGQLAGFEINVVNSKGGTLFFTDFKIAR